MICCQIGGSELDKAPRSPFSIPSHEDEFISRLPKNRHRSDALQVILENFEKNQKFNSQNMEFRCFKSIKT